MTTEERFKQLLEIACDNGFDVSKFFHNKDYNHIVEIEKQFICCDSGFNSNKYSLNDLVLQTNFFECLFKNVKNDIRFSYLNRYDWSDRENSKIVNDITCFKFQWVLEVENNNALNWLFKQFNL